MSKKPTRKIPQASAPSKSIAAALTRYCTTLDIQGDAEHFGSIVTLMAAAEDRAVACLMAGAGLLSFHQCGELDIWIRCLADDVYGNDGAVEEKVSDILEMSDGRLQNIHYARQSNLIKAAYALGLATGARLGGAR